MEECSIGRVLDWKSVGLEECWIGKSVELEECKNGREQNWKSLRLEECKIELEDCENV